MATRLAPPSADGPHLWKTAGCLVLGWVLMTTTLQNWLSQSGTATALISPRTYEKLIQSFSDVKTERIGATEFHTIAWLSLALITAGVLGLLWGMGAISLLIGTPAHHRGRSLRWWSLAVGSCAITIGLWDWAWLLASLIAGVTGQVLLMTSLPFWLAVCLSGLFTAWFMIKPIPETARSLPAYGTSIFPGFRVGLLVLIYTAVFVTMNWRLWFNLYLPHGDSAMYEEHLWNLLHGKGFRSYLDQGLFLGEHIQVVHLGLIPLYLLWPSHLLLELCESLSLAAGAFPIAWMTWRHTQSRTATIALAATYLLYTPMQFLDIEIDLKTFRPEAFGIPLMLLTLDQLDRGRCWTFFIGVLACLTVKEDVALILVPLGFWIAGTAWRHSSTESSSITLRGIRWQLSGILLACGGLLYLWLATRVVMPYFRTGQEIHYASYFSRLGESPEAIIRTVFTRPGFVLGELCNLTTFLYLLALLLPVAGVAVASPGRLAVGLPLFGVLCLNELARDPRHQFHAWLVAILFWATACGLPDFIQLVGKCYQRLAGTACSCETMTRFVSHAVWTSSLTTGFFFSLSPLGISFWDPGSNWFWKKLYGPNERGAQFEKVRMAIPETSRVASTDFVHPRFTHYERSYDYSHYLRQASGYERRVPADTEYIVIDATHPYSEMHRPEDVPEYHDSDHWEFVPIDTDGNFIVLRKLQHRAKTSSDQLTD